MAFPYGPPRGPALISPPGPVVTNPMIGGAQTPAWVNPLLFGGLALASQGASLTPQSSLAPLLGGLQMGVQANALQNEQVRQNEMLNLRREEMAAKREERERLAMGRTQAADILAQMAGGREMVGPLQPGIERPMVEGLSAEEGAMRLMTIPGYEETGARMLGQQTAAAQRADEFSAAQAHREAVLAETVRHNRQAEQAAAAKLANVGQFGAEDVRSTRSQYEQATRKDRDAVKAYEGVRKLASTESPSIASDTALIFQFMKTLDPTSTVREGEVATVQNATGIPDRVRNMYNRAMGGEALNAQQRQEIEAAARMAVEPRMRALKSVNETYTGIAMRGGANPSDIVTFEVPAALLEPPQFPTAVTYGTGLNVGLPQAQPIITPPAGARPRSVLDLPE